MADRDAQREEETISDYFKKGFTYYEILALLDKYHGIRMSTATLKRRIKEYGLKRRNVRYDLNSVRNKIRSLLDGPDCMGGYRHIWHALKMQGISVPRSVFRNFCGDVHKLLPWCLQTIAVMFSNFCRDVHKLLP